MPFIIQPAPIIAIAGAGVVAADITPAFCGALHSKPAELSAVRILTRSQPAALTDPKSPVHRADLAQYQQDGAEIHKVDYTDSTTLDKALQGVDALLCIFGTYKGNWNQSQKALALAGEDQAWASLLTCIFYLRPAVRADVKVFFPSKWGVDTRVGGATDWELAYVAKREFFDWAAKLSNEMRVVGVFQGLHLDKAFRAWGGFDSATSRWQVVGGGNTPVAMTAQRDAGPAALRTALLALERPSEVPQFVRFQSVNITLSQYAACFEKVSGLPIELVKQDWQDARFEYLERQGFCTKFEVLGLHLRNVMEEGGLDQTEHHNELINPGEKYFKWTTAEQYAKEIGGKPWDNYTMPKFV